MSGGRVGLLPLSILFSSAEYAQPPSSLATRPEEASRRAGDCAWSSADWPVCLIAHGETPGGRTGGAICISPGPGEENCPHRALSGPIGPHRARS